MGRGALVWNTSFLLLNASFLSAFSFAVHSCAPFLLPIFLPLHLLLLSAVELMCLQTCIYLFLSRCHHYILFIQVSSTSYINIIINKQSKSTASSSSSQGYPSNYPIRKKLLTRLNLVPSTLTSLPSHPSPLPPHHPMSSGSATTRDPRRLRNNGRSSLVPR